MVLTAFFLLVAIFKENSHTFYSTMTIVGYEEQDDVVYINYNSKNELTETIPARQLLATNPILLEIYNYQNDVTLETRVEKRINKVEYMPRRMQMMIIDYFEVNHCKKRYL